MNMIIIYGIYPPIKSGAGDYARQLGKSLTKNGHSISVITSLVPEIESIYIKDKIVVNAIIKDWRYKGLFKGELKSLVNKIKEINPDILITIYPQGKDNVLPYIIKLALPKIKLLTIFFMFSVDGPIYKIKNIIYNIFQLGVSFFLCVSTNWLLFHDEALFKFFKKIPMFQRKCHLVPMAPVIDIDLNRNYSIANIKKYRRIIKFPINCKLIGFFGFWHGSKGVDILIRAFSKLRAYRDDIKLVLIGGQKGGVRFKETLYLINNIDISSDIFITGHLNSSEMINYLLGIDICVLPYRYFMTGRSSLALSIKLGLPIITTSYCQKSLLLEDHVNAILVPPNNIDKLSTAMDELLNNNKLRQKLVENIANIGRQIDWNIIVRKIVNLYNKEKEVR